MNYFEDKKDEYLDIAKEALDRGRLGSAKGAGDMGGKVIDYPILDRLMQHDKQDMIQEVEPILKRVYDTQGNCLGTTDLIDLELVVPLSEYGVLTSVDGDFYIHFDQLEKLKESNPSEYARFVRAFEENGMAIPKKGYDTPEVQNICVNQAALKNKKVSFSYRMKKVVAIGLAAAIVSLAPIGFTACSKSDNDLGPSVSQDLEKDYMSKISQLIDDSQGILIVEEYINEVQESNDEAVARAENEEDWDIDAYKGATGITKFEELKHELDRLKYEIDLLENGKFEESGYLPEDLNGLRFKYSRLLYELAQFCYEDGAIFGEGRYAKFATAKVVDGIIYYEVDLAKLESGQLPEGTTIIGDRLYAPNDAYSFDTSPGTMSF